MTGSIRREALDHILITNEAHARQVLAAYQRRYNTHRPHRSKSFVLPEIGQLLKIDDPWEPCQLLDPFGRPVEPAAVYFTDLKSADCSPLTPRSYGMDLLRWWRPVNCTMSQS
ncbi:integrase core domain-containing protein [Streptomyces violaceusniger]|uniref:integrase core domain-containing protein n=1 Tax=Streptomyces violaceusniger TaxID=68280 RepID=UPI003F49E6AE